MVSSLVGCCGGAVGCVCCHVGASSEGSNIMVRRSGRLVRDWNHVCCIDSCADWTCRRWFFQKKMARTMAAAAGLVYPMAAALVGGFLWLLLCFA